MTDSGRAWRVALALAAAAVYFGTPQVARPVSPHYEHFPRFASAYLQGRLSVTADEGDGFRVEELIAAGEAGRWYMPYPPLPAILLMPFVAVFGASVKSAVACRALSVLNVALVDVLLARMLTLANFPHGEGGARAILARRRLLGVFFAFGVVTWHNSHAGGDWHLAHAVALSGALLALIEFHGRCRSGWIGAAIAAVILTRPTAACVGVLCVMPLIRSRDWSGVARMAAGPVVAVILLAGQNTVRFGHPLDFGYSRMALGGAGARLMAEYGQFHLHFVARNLYWFFLAPPWLRDAGFPVGFDPRGMSVFLASPALALAGWTAVRRWSEPRVRDATMGILVGLAGLLLYFNTGFWQFGHRFSMDYLALCMVLMGRVAAERSTRSLGAWVGASVLIQAIGNLDQPVARLPAWLAPWG